MSRRLTRDTRGGVIGGVASGLGQYLDVDPVLVRLAFVLLFFANGLGLLAYLVCWVMIPRSDPEAPPVAAPATEAAGQGVNAVREAGSRVAEEVRGAGSRVAGEVRSAAAGVKEAARDAAPEPARAQAVVGAVLMAGGVLMLADNFGWLRWPDWADIGTLWPLLLVGLGVGLIARSRGSATA